MLGQVWKQSAQWPSEMCTQHFDRKLHEHMADDQQFFFLSFLFCFYLFFLLLVDTINTYTHRLNNIEYQVWHKYFFVDGLHCRGGGRKKIHFGKHAGGFCPYMPPYDTGPRASCMLCVTPYYRQLTFFFFFNFDVPVMWKWYNSNWQYL